MMFFDEVRLRHTTLEWHSGKEIPPLHIVEYAGESWLQSESLLLVDISGTMSVGYCQQEQGREPCFEVGASGKALGYISWWAVIEAPLWTIIEAPPMEDLTPRIRRPSARYVAAGLVAACLLVTGYLVGTRQHRVGTVATLNIEADRRNSGEFETEEEVRGNLETTLLAKETEIASLNARIASATKEAKRLRQLADEAVSARDSSTAENARLAAENANLLRSREDLERLERSENQAQASLASTQGQLAQLRSQREKDLAQSEDLRNQVAALTSETAVRERTIEEQRKLLESDKDIRDLMGARDLYIADVYDVDGDNQRPKPFGRVFYTRDKSLIFYAFDLDQQAGLRAASFQAWGLKDGDQDHPHSMGIFYRDNEIHRRWMLKFEDQHIDQIQAVFVTVEPIGGSHKPHGRQLLYASLRMTPNHP